MSSIFFNKIVENNNIKPMYVVGTEKPCKFCDGHARDRLLRREIKGQWVMLLVQQTHCCRWTAACEQHDTFDLSEDLRAFKFGFGESPENAISVYKNFIEGRALISHLHGRERQDEDLDIREALDRC